MHPKHKHLPPEYWVWCSMRQRCNNPNNSSYKDYGARGISYSDEWNDFHTFYKDMGSRPEGQFTLERMDNDKGYSKENCKWATRLEQIENRRCSRNITFNGITMNIFKWAVKIGIKPRTLYARLTEYKWTVDRALTEGVRNWK